MTSSLDPMTGPEHDRDIDRLDRRIDEVSERLRDLDSHGSRGVAVLQTQVQSLAGTLGEVKGAVAGLRNEVTAEIKLVKAGRWQIALGIMLALAPAYAGVIYNFVR